MDKTEQDITQKVEVLQKELAETQDTGERLNLYLEIVDELQKSDVPKAIGLCTEAVELARQAALGNGALYSDVLSDSLIHLAALYARGGNYLKSISIITGSLPLIEENGNRYLLARACNIAGVSFENLGNYSDAIDYFTRALAIFQEIGDQSWEAGVLNNIGHLYWELDNPSWAQMYLSSSLELAEKQKDLSLQGDICETLCTVNLDSNDCKKALEFGLRALSLYQQIENRHAEAEVCDSIGDVYQKQGESEKALEYYRKALRLSQETGHHHEEIEAFLRIGRYYTGMGQCESAGENLKRALEIASRLETKHSIYECHKALMQLHKTCGDFKQALEHGEQLFCFYRQMHNEEQNNRIQSIAAKHQIETMQKDAEIYRLKNAALQDEIDLRKKAQENLQLIASKDHLTGLYNRYYFFEVAESGFRQVIIDHEPLSIIMIDVDNFKLVNDRYGHTTGDVILQKMAATLQSGLRKGDIVARYGGDEFVILLPGTNSVYAGEIAERLRGLVDSQAFQSERNLIHVTCSFGITSYTGQQIENFETLLKQADMAMYEAKQTGGNCIRFCTQK